MCQKRCRAFSQQASGPVAVTGRGIGGSVVDAGDAGPIPGQCTATFEQNQVKEKSVQIYTLSRTGTHFTALC